MKKYLKHSLLLGAALVAFSSCNKDDDTPGPINEPEVITSLGLVIAEASTPGTPIDTFWFRDDNRLGGGMEILESIFLDASTDYVGWVIVLNETSLLYENASASDWDDVDFNKTLEIEEEDDEHQFFYVRSSAALWTAFAYEDADDNGDPVGIQFSFTTGAGGSGNLTVILRHELDKGAPGVSGGDPTNAGGETDIEVTFPMFIGPGPF